MKRDVRYFREHIQKIIRQMLTRADDYLENNVTIMKPNLLLNVQQFQEEFTKEVITDIKKPVDDIVNEASSLIAQRAKTQSRSVLEYVATRPRLYSEAMIGAVTPTSENEFDTVRLQLIERLTRDTNEVLVLHDQKKIVTKISNKMKTAMYEMGTIQAVSALSLGGLLAANMFDLSGMVALSSAALLSLLVVPWRKSEVRKAYEKQLMQLEEQLDTTISNIIEKELNIVRERILNTISPYSRFIISEDKKINELKKEFSTIKESVRNLQAKVKSKK